MRILIGTFALAATVTASSANDLGTKFDDLLAAQSPTLFGIAAPLAASAPPTGPGYRKATDTAANLVSLAPGLTARIVTRNAANIVDQLTLYPAVRPTHLIACVEVGRSVIGKTGSGANKLNPSVQRINIATGQVETILRGMHRCDGVRVTPWNTVVANEETVDGHVYEILNPLTTTEVTVDDRATGAVSAPALVAQRAALPMIAWEGMEVMGNGVVYGGDELGPGASTPGAPGGGVYKFIPSTLYVAGTAVSTLAASPLAAGKSYAMRISCQPTTVVYGQGCQVGTGDWVQIDPATARADAEANGATGYYRPEDMTRDKTVKLPATKLCFTATGNHESKQFAEVICLTDSSVATAPERNGGGNIVHTVVAQQFVLGGPTFNSFDNVDFQPGRNNLHLVEDAPNGDGYACLADGPDADLMSDGCIRWLSVKDSSAEPSGILFNSAGRKAYLSISHSDDSDPSITPVDDFRTDDIIEISGFR